MAKKLHKWVQDRHTAISKRDRCVKCDTYREWCYGDFSCWEYWQASSETNTDGSNATRIRKSFTRPECGGKI